MAMISESACNFSLFLSLSISARLLFERGYTATAFNHYRMPLHLMMGMLAENPQESFHEQALIAIDKDSQVAKKVNVALIEFADKNP